MTVFNKTQEKEALKKNETFSWEIESIDGLGNMTIKFNESINWDYSK